MTSTQYAALFPIVAQRPTRLAHVIVHCAINIPFSDKTKPQSCVILRNKSDEKKNQAISSSLANCTRSIPGKYPYWNEMIYVSVPEKDVEREEMQILIYDESRREITMKNEIRWNWLIPFHQYHLKLVQLIDRNEPPIYLYISLMVKLSALHEKKQTFYGLETYLSAFDYPLLTPQRIYAVVRLVSDYEQYKELLDNNSRDLGIKFKTVNGHQQDFFVPSYPSVGYPRVSLASQQNPVALWNHDFIFSRLDEIDLIFSNPDAAIVFEFYAYENPAIKTQWEIAGLLGWAALRLDKRTQDSLVSSPAINGMRTQGFVVQHDGDLAPEGSKHQTVRVYLRLLREPHPEKTLLRLSPNNLPILPSYYQDSIEKYGQKPVYWQIDFSKDYVPPVETAIPQLESPAPQPVPIHSQAAVQQTQIYQPPSATMQPVPLQTMAMQPMPQPAYPPIQYEMKTQPYVMEKQSTARFRVPRINPYDLDDIPAEYRAMLVSSYPPSRDDDVDGWLDYFQREVAMYKLAIRRVIQDVTQLRGQQKSLTEANADLRKKTEKFDQKAKVLADILEGDKIDKVKIQEIFNQLKARISAQALLIKENEIKIINYEKELARRAELRQHYDALSQTSQARDAELKLLKQRLEKAQGLEETVRRQELVIERLETIIRNTNKEKRSRGTFNDLDRVLMSDPVGPSYYRPPYTRPPPPSDYFSTNYDSKENDPLKNYLEGSDKNLNSKTPRGDF